LNISNRPCIASALVASVCRSALVLAALLLLSAANGLAQISPFPGNDWASLNDAGEKAYERRQYAASENFLRAALQQAETFGPNDLRLATTLNDLGLLYRALGKLQEAESFYRRSLAIREKKLGPSDLQVTTSLNNLAGVLTAENRYAAAEQMYRRALVIRQTKLGKDNPQVATVLNNLAAMFSTQEKYAQAEI